MNADIQLRKRLYRRYLPVFCRFRSTLCVGSGAVVQRHAFEDFVQPFWLTAVVSEIDDMVWSIEVAFSGMTVRPAAAEQAVFQAVGAEDL